MTGVPADKLSESDSWLHLFDADSVRLLDLTPQLQASPLVSPNEILHSLTRQSD